MNRRVFLASPIFCSVAFSKDEDEWAILESVQKHLFPKSKKYVGASQFEATRYLKFVSKDGSFDESDLRFIFRGIKEIKSRGYKIDLAHAQKEKILQEFAKERFGENWISTVLNYTLEALFSDPIYGGNKNEIGWKSFNHNPGFPRPKKRFGAIDV